MIGSLFDYMKRKIITGVFETKFSKKLKKWRIIFPDGKIIYVSEKKLSKMFEHISKLNKK